MSNFTRVLETDRALNEAVRRYEEASQALFGAISAGKPSTVIARRRRQATVLYRVVTRLMAQAVEARLAYEPLDPEGDGAMADEVDAIVAEINRNAVVWKAE